jgi:hypothetical protein
MKSPELLENSYISVVKSKTGVTMDNCQRAGSCQPAGTSLPVDLTAARVPRCGLSKRGKEANIHPRQAVNPSGIVFALARMWEIQRWII